MQEVLVVQTYRQILSLEGMIRARGSTLWRKPYIVKTLVSQTPQQEENKFDTALAKVLSTMYAVTTEKEDGGARLGPTLMSEVQLEGCPVKTLLDTGSPTTTFSLEFL